MAGAGLRVLIVEDDVWIVDLVREVLEDEGYVLVVLGDRTEEALRAALDGDRPDCILLDGEGAGNFGVAWDIASWLAARSDSVPVVMFTADHDAAKEAVQRESERSRAADFFAVLPKPFDLDELASVVARAVGASPSRDHSDEDGRPSRA